MNLLTKAVLDLVDGGLRDPSVSEIAAQAFPHLIEPPNDPLDQPPGLGGEVYDGIAKRLGKICLELEAGEGRLAATVNERYYQGKFRRAASISAAQAAVLIPSAHLKAQGIRVTIDGEDDPVYLAWQRANGKAGATRVGRASSALDIAHTNGIVTTAEGVAALTDFEGRIGDPMAARIAQIQARKLNGKGLPTP